MAKRLTVLLTGLVTLAGCGQSEPQPRTVTEFLDNPILLEAAMVRCNQDRSGNRYEQECINAREAVKRIQAKEEQERRIELEARSEAKRRALRRTQQAAAEARRRAAEAERRREEAEYLAQFGVLPPREGETGEALPEGNVPLAVIPEAQPEAAPGRAYDDAVPATQGGNTPGVSVEPAQQPEPQPEATTPEEPPAESAPVSDLDAVREELRRRSENDGD